MYLGLWWKLDVFLHKDVLLNTCGDASLNGPFPWCGSRNILINLFQIPVMGCLGGILIKYIYLPPEHPIIAIQETIIQLKITAVSPKKFHSPWRFWWWTLWCSVLPMSGEEWLDGRVCLVWKNLWLPRTCPGTATKLNINKSFPSFENFQAKFHSLLCIFWYRILYPQDVWFRNLAKMWVNVSHFVFVWIMHYSLIIHSH